MGADNVVVCYGARFSLGTDGLLQDDALEALEHGTDPRMVAARRAGLKAYWGRLTDGGEYFMLIGTILGTFGIEGLDRFEANDSTFAAMAADTRQRLVAAGISVAPALHVQFEGQY